MPIPPTHEPDDDAGRRRHAAILGMWVFLAAEAVFFGGALVCFAAYAWQHGPEFAKAGNLTNLALGAANTAVLLTSSWTMAMAVHASHAGRRRTAVLLLAATALLGGVFLGVKAAEYLEEFHRRLVPGSGFRGSATAELFFTCYFVLTGIHALHLLIGIAILVALAGIAMKARGLLVRRNVVEIVGLYWHFVDIVWIFLFPVLYLRGRHF